MVKGMGSEQFLQSMTNLGRRDMLYVGDHLTLLFYQIYKMLVSWFQRMYFKFFFHKSIGADDHWAVVNLDPMGKVSCRPHGFRRFFNIFPIISQLKRYGLWALPIWIPGAWLSGFLKWTTRHCYILIKQAVAFMYSVRF